MSKSAMHFELAFVEAIQEALVSGKNIRVPGLGTFAISHQPAIVQTGNEVRVLPPENRLTFVGEGEDDFCPEFTSR